MKAALARLIERRAGWIIVICVYLAATAVVLPLSGWGRTPTP